jgi:hypothetical protein
VLAAADARRSLGKRLRQLVPAAVAAAVLPLSAAAGAGTAPRLEAPEAADIADAGAINDGILTGPVVRRTTAAIWGGTFPTPSGESVTLEISDRYPQDQGVAERWAAFLGGLVHGPELSTLTAFIAPLREVQRTCGAEALACYSPRDGLLVAPGEDVLGQASAEALIAHEYGHHIAANRDNPPWDAVDFGTKRWASYERICSDARAGRVFPGEEEDRRRYMLNPGEGFAEAYRVLNERKLGLVESPWEIVSRIFYPDAQALIVLERDVMTPWTMSSTSTLKGSFTVRGKSHSHSVTTALDGTLRVTLRAPSSAHLRVELLKPSGTRIAQATVRGGSRTVRTTVCGSRSHTVRVTRLDGRGKYALTVAKP